MSEEYRQTIFIMKNMTKRTADLLANTNNLPEPTTVGAVPNIVNVVSTPANTTSTKDFQVEIRDDGAVVQSKQIGRYKVEVIRSKCISAASCVAIAPKVFQLDEEGIAVVISQDGESDDIKLLAAQSCPTAAIVVTDTNTNQQVWPI